MFALIDTLDNTVVQYSNTKFPSPVRLIWISAPSKYEGNFDIKYNAQTGALYDPMETVDLAVIQDEKMSQIKNYRDELINEGIVYNGVQIKVNSLTEQRLIGARVKAEADSNFVIQNWSAENGWFTLDAATIITLSDLVSDKVQDLFNKTKAHDDNIKLLVSQNNRDDLINYDITQNW